MDKDEEFKQLYKKLINTLKTLSIKHNMDPQRIANQAVFTIKNDKINQEVLELVVRLAFDPKYKSINAQLSMKEIAETALRGAEMVNGEESSNLKAISIVANWLATEPKLE